MHHGHPLQFLRAQHFALSKRFFQRAEHQRERRAEFVADIREKRRLCTVNFGQRFGPPTFLFIGVGVGHRRRHLAGDEPQKVAIPAVEQPEGIQTNDQYAAPPGIAGRQNRQQRHL